MDKNTDFSFRELIFGTSHKSQSYEGKSEEDEKTSFVSALNFQEKLPTTFIPESTEKKSFFSSNGAKNEKARKPSSVAACSFSHSQTEKTLQSSHLGHKYRSGKQSVSFDQDQITHDDEELVGLIICDADIDFLIQSEFVTKESIVNLIIKITSLPFIPKNYYEATVKILEKEIISLDELLQKSVLYESSDGQPFPL